MEKQFYKNLTAVGEYNQNYIEWKQVVKHAKPKLFTPEFVEKYKKELVNADIMLVRPKIAVRSGITLDYLRRMASRPLFDVDISHIPDIAKKINELIIEGKYHYMHDIIIACIDELVKFPGIVIDNISFKFLSISEANEIRVLSDIRTLLDMLNCGDYFERTQFCGTSPLFRYIEFKYFSPSGNENSNAAIKRIVTGLYRDNIISAYDSFRYIATYCTSFDEDLKSELLEHMTKLEIFQCENNHSWEMQKPNGVQKNDD